MSHGPSRYELFFGYGAPWYQVDDGLGWNIPERVKPYGIAWWDWTDVDDPDDMKKVPGWTYITLDEFDRWLKRNGFTGRIQSNSKPKIAIKRWTATPHLL